MEEEFDTFDMQQEERMWPTVEEPEEIFDGPLDSSDDGEALASAGMGTDEDYGSLGGEDSFLDGSYEEA